MQIPSEVQLLLDAVTELPGVAKCDCNPRPLGSLEVQHLSLPGEFGDLPHATLRRTDGGLEGEVMVQVEVVLDRSPSAWLTLEFLAWWTRDWGRSGQRIQMRPVALPPKGHEIQLGRTLRFLIENFVIEESDTFETSLGVVRKMAESITSNFEDYRDCFDRPAC